MQNWVFTINFDHEPTDDECRTPEAWPGILYAIWQLEKGEETGRFHLQGYIRLEKKSRLSALKKIHATAHWEVRRGSHNEAKAYCSKEDTRIKGPWHIGQDEPDAEPKQGQRTDLLAVKCKLDEGLPMERIAEEHFPVWIKYPRALQEYKRLKMPRRQEKTQVLILVGPTGVGKSHLAHNMFPKAYWVDNPRSKENSVWWNDYDGISPVIIDEFYGWLPYTFMLRLLDKYHMKVETKGGFVNFSPKHLVITSNKFPEDWYDTNKCSFEPLLRRLDIIATIDFTRRLKILKDEHITYDRHILTNTFFNTQINVADLYS